MSAVQSHFEFRSISYTKVANDTFGSLGGWKLLLDRRKFIVGTSASLIAAPTLGQEGSDILQSQVDGGLWHTIPDFLSILTPEKLESLSFVAGLRPERRLNGIAQVRLELEYVDGHPKILHNYGHSGAGVTMGLGCASLAEARLSQTSGFSKTSRIVIVGAGIIGLSMAYILKRRGYRNIRIQADKVSSGSFDAAVTVSDIAGGQFDAAGIGDISGNICTALTSQTRLDSVLTQTLAALVERRAERYDPFRVEGRRDRYIYTVARNYTANPNKIPAELMQASAVVVSNPAIKKWLEDFYLGKERPKNGISVVAPFESLQKTRIGTSPFMLGASDTILINTPNMIKNIKKYLGSNIDAPPVQIRSGSNYYLESYADLLAIDTDLVINCTGMGGALTGGPSEIGRIGGIYGLLAKLEPLPIQYEARRPRYLYSGFGYMFPRSDGIVVGGAWGDYAPLALERRTPSQAATLATIDKRRYAQSLLVTSANDASRARAMVSTVGNFFLGRREKVETLRTEVDEWLSGRGQFDCVLDRSRC